ncbi:MAG: class I SAM-dependent methyltransferase [Atopobiaceae bacterium]|nr:class I SAM-dependent methyltransferase [Atopobiaceae bacterium]
MEFFATCPAGFERLLANELAAQSISGIRPLTGQVSFSGPLDAAYRACLWSRIASRVIVVLGRVSATSSDALYEEALALPWEDHVPPNASFAIDASGINEALRNTRFTALRVKDAIADRIYSKRSTRPLADPKNPNMRLVARVSGNHATLGIDLAGSPLFNRGYERGRSGAGLRPDYAAALLALGQWSFEAANNASTLLALASNPDHLLIEAALVACSFAPGLLRAQWGFERWTHHDEGLWEGFAQEAQERKDADVSVRLYARSLGSISLRAKSILRSLGISIQVTPLSSSTEALPQDVSCLVADLSDIREHEMAKESSWLGTLARIAQETQPSIVSVAARNKLPEAFLRNESKTVLWGKLGRDALAMMAIRPEGNQTPLPTVEVEPGKDVTVLVPASDQFAARLKKIARARAKWARRTDVSCYRVYDADLPDYAVTIDLFQGCDPVTGNTSGQRWLQIYEYAPPKGVDKDLARCRLMDVLAIAPRILEVREENTFLRIRKRDKGGSQYAAEARGIKPANRNAKHPSPLAPGSHLIDEGGLLFEVNFSSRLDCGIFLDHRDTRAMIREMAKQTKGSKRFLNLFAYTGSATCYAADGGMRYTTTVDLSRPSLDWARRNMQRNGFTGPNHEYVQTDVVSWVREQRRTKNRWDLVFCDVPTFSNSSRMGRRSFDVQRDHAELLISVSRLLTQNGICVFSCNLKSFKPDTQKLAKAGVQIEDITEQTIPEDFRRNARVHHAYLVRRTPRDL